MSTDRFETFRHDGEELPITDDVVLTAVGILDRFHDEVKMIEIRGPDDFLVRYGGRLARMSAIELIGIAHTHYGERWHEAIEALDVEPVDAA